MTVIAQGQEIKKIIYDEEMRITPVVWADNISLDVGYLLKEEDRKPKKAARAEEIAVVAAQSFSQKWKQFLFGDFKKPQVKHKTDEEREQEQKELHQSGAHVSWGLAYPRMLIQSWRAMQILAEVPKIQTRTLCSTWYMAQKNHDRFEEKLTRDLKSTMDDYFIAGILESFPGEEEFSSMLDLLLEEKIYDAIEEIMPYVEAGQLPELPQVLKLSELYEEQKSRLAREFIEKQDAGHREMAEPIHGI